MNTVVPFILDILKYTAAGTAVFFIAYSVLKNEIEKNRQMKEIELRKATLSTTIPLRLQAYERVTLFIERMNPASLLVRSHTPGISVLQFQQMLVSEVQNEFQHNVTQQVYLSVQAWTVVRRLKDDTISLINNCAKRMDMDSPSIELSKAVLAHLSVIEENPYEAALTLIKADLQDVI